MVRILLMLGLAATAGVAGWQVWSLEQTRSQQRADLDSLEAIAARAPRAVLDIRASQRAYLSPGQGLGFWKPRVDQQLLALRGDLDSLKDLAAASASASPGVTSASPAAAGTRGAADAAAADDGAIEALGEVSRLERRTAEHVQAGRLDHAADLVYADSVRASLALERALDAALKAHRQDLQAQQATHRWREIGILALSGVFGLLFGLLLGLARRSVAGDAAEAADAAGADATGAANARAAGATAGATVTPDAAGVRSGSGGRPGSAERHGPAEKPGLAMQGGAAAHAGASGHPGAAEAGGGTPDLSISREWRPREPRDARPPVPASALRSGPQERAAHERDRAASGSPSRTGTSPAGSTMTDRGLEHVTAGQPPAAGAVRGPAADAAALDSMSASTLAATLTAAADLCASLARVGDADGLQPILARVAEQLDAVGLIVWLEDAGEQALTPAMAHGYPAETLARLPAIARDVDNATARAFRLAQPQIVDSHGAAPGALVIPLQTAAGCVGVLAAELRHGREHDPATLALARIVSAQLAMLTGPAAPATP